MSRRATILRRTCLVTALCACHGPEVGGPLDAGGLAAAPAAGGPGDSAGGGTAPAGGGANGGGSGEVSNGGAAAGGGSPGSGGGVACVEGTESSASCEGGINGRATRILVCRDGALEELVPCTDPDECADDALRGACPASVEVCIMGHWQADPSRCDACGIVTCTDGSGAACCSGWGAFALTASTYLHDPHLVDALTIEPEGVTAEFSFTQVGQLGIISLDVPVERPIDYQVRVTFTSEGAVMHEISFDRDQAGIAVGLDPSGAPDLSYVQCFPPGSTCIESYSRINLRLVSTAPGAATLTVTGIDTP